MPTMKPFEKLKEVRKRVRDIYPKMSDEELMNIVGFIDRKWYGNKRRKGITLTKKQLTVYEILRQMGYKPFTVYKWILLWTAPQELREKVRKQELSIKQALTLRKAHTQYATPSEQEFMNAVVNCIELYFSDAGEGYPAVMGK